MSYIVILILVDVKLTKVKYLARSVSNKLITSVTLLLNDSLNVPLYVFEIFNYKYSNY